MRATPPPGKATKGEPNFLRKVTEASSMLLTDLLRLLISPQAKQRRHSSQAPGRQSRHVGSFRKSEVLVDAVMIRASS